MWREPHRWYVVILEESGYVSSSSSCAQLCKASTCMSSHDGRSSGQQLDEMMDGSREGLAIYRSILEQGCHQAKARARVEDPVGACQNSKLPLQQGRGELVLCKARSRRRVMIVRRNPHTVLQKMLTCTHHHHRPPHINSPQVIMTGLIPPN